MQLKCPTAYRGWRVIKRFVERINESSITICHTNYVVSCNIKGAAYRYLLLSLMSHQTYFKVPFVWEKPKPLIESALLFKIQILLSRSG